MTTYDLRKKTDASTVQRIISLGNNIRGDHLEKRIDKQEEKLNKILELLQNGNNIPNTNK